jgi:hypothetical protein
LTLLRQSAILCSIGLILLIANLLQVILVSLESRLLVVGPRLFLMIKLTVYLLHTPQSVIYIRKLHGILENILVMSLFYIIQKLKRAKRKLKK